MCRRTSELSKAVAQSDIYNTPLLPLSLFVVILSFLMDKSVWKKNSSFPGVKQASTINCELLQIFRVSKYDCVVGTIYTSTRA